MENPILKAKKELIHWINALDDLDVLSELIELKEKDESIPLVAESQAEYVLKDDFDERFLKGMSSENARIESKKRVREWWGK